MNVGDAIVALLLLLVLTLGDGLVFMFLWGWFAVPLLNLPAIPYVGAIGLMIIISYVTQPRPNVSPDIDNLDWKELIQMRVISMTMFLFCGFIMSLFLPVIG